YHRMRTLLFSIGLQVTRCPLRLAATTRYCVVDHQHHDRSDNCDDHAVKIEAGHAGRTEEIEQKTAHQGANDPQRDVEPKTLALLVDNLASDKPGNQAEYDPADDAHGVLQKSSNPRKSKSGTGSGERPIANFQTCLRCGKDFPPAVFGVDENLRRRTIRSGCSACRRFAGGRIQTLRESGTFPPFSASLIMTCLCNQTFIAAVSFVLPA